MNKYLAILLLLLAPLLLLADETILVGDILSESTGEPIPAANIYFAGTRIGTASDENGSFMLRADLSRKRTLVVSAVGYHTQRYPIEAGTMAGMQVALRERTAILEEVIALPGENPALPLLAAVRAARPQNDRTLLPVASTAEASTELYISDIQRRHLRRALWRSLSAGMLTAEDSTFLLPLYRSTQSVRLAGNDITPLAPKQEQAVILTANDYSALLTTQGNINFYRSSIPLLGHSFLSPLAPSGATYYRYYLVDSIPTASGKVYRVDFRTRNPFYATFNGTLTIDSASLALVAVTASVPAQSSVNYLSDLRLSQTFAPDRTLLSEDLSVLLDFAVKTDTSHLFPTVLLRRRLTAPQTTDTALVAPTAPIITDNIPLPQDPTPLFDSLAATPLIRTAKWVASIITTGYIPTGTPVDIGHVEEIIGFNPQETVHLGLPLRTNEQLWQNVSLEAAVGYGFRDQAWKGMGRIQLNLPTLRRNTLAFEYRDGYAYTEVDDFSRLLRENSMTKKNMDLTAYLLKSVYTTPYALNSASRRRQFQVWTENDWTDCLETNLYLRLGTQGYGDPMVGYSQIPYYRYQSLGAIFRLGFHERKVDLYFRRIHVYSQYPVLYLGLEAGSWQTDAMPSYSLYAHLRLLLRQRVSLGMGGSLDWALSAGWLFGNVPYPLLHHFEGNQSYAYDPYRFTLMNNFQYAADRYLALHAEWNGRGILFNLIPGIRYLRLRELISFKLAYGTLTPANQSLLASFPAPTANDAASSPYALPLRSMSVPYVEFGIGIGNILRVADLYSVWRLTNRQDPTTPLWSLRFRLHLGL